MKFTIALVLLFISINVLASNAPSDVYKMTYLDRLLITMEMKEPEFEDEFYIVGFRKKGSNNLLVEFEKSNEFKQKYSKNIAPKIKEKMASRRKALEDTLTKDIRREINSLGMKNVKIVFSDL